MNRNLRYSLLLFAAITAVTFGSSFIFNLIGRTLAFSPIGRLGMLFLAAVISSAIITLIIISTAPVLKNYLTTFRQLLRLDTLSHPLLLKMQKEAPATFQHNLNVAALAHRAAKSIGGDSFLTRIGAYYHDIGKLSNPEFFIENRRNSEKTTETIDPLVLVKQIHNHVKDGIKLAREYKLPEDVIAFIPQHHGTLLVSYLYDKAKQAGKTVRKQDFRYLGPKPLSKEAGILMLADAIESRLRTVPELNDKDIIQIVDSTIKSRLEERQLELSGLTNLDLAKIRKALIEAAQSVYHQRIKYPNDATHKK